MTDEMAIQGQRPSAIPYLAGGALLGGVVGGGAAAAGYGLSSPAYKSWEDAVSEVNKNDAFVKKQVEKGGDNKANWEAIQNQAKAVKEAQTELEKVKMPEGFEAKKELEAVIDKEIAVADAQKAITKKYEAAYNKELENLKKMEIKADKPYQFKGVDYNQEDFRKLLNSTKEEDKALVKELVESTEAYKQEIGKADFVKTEKEALEKAQDSLKKAEEDLVKKDTKGLASGVRETLGNAKKKLAEANSSAKEKLTEDLLSKCKKVSTWKTAAIGAAILGLAGLLVRPSGEEA